MPRFVQAVLLGGVREAGREGSWVRGPPEAKTQGPVPRESPREPLGCECHCRLLLTPARAAGLSDSCPPVSLRRKKFLEVSFCSSPRGALQRRARSKSVPQEWGRGRLNCLHPRPNGSTHDSAAGHHGEQAFLLVAGFFPKNSQKSFFKRKIPICINCVSQAKRSID